MKMFNKIKSLFQKSKKEAEAKTPKVRQKKEKSVDEPPLSPKELATKNNEPYFAVLSVEIDKNNMRAGSFELDWNDKFVINLIKLGYQMKPEDTDQVIVDRWFQSVCRDIALEIYEQQQADPFIRQYQSRDIGNGRTEVS